MYGDLAIVALIESGRLRVDSDNGLVFAPKSNTPEKPVGAVTKKGYLRACITVAGRQMHFMVHRIVWVAAHGPLPRGHQIDHSDMDKRNNRLANLESVPALVNMRRAKEAGLCRGNGRTDDIRDSRGRFGKKSAGRLLDGRQWDEYPAPTPDTKGGRS